MEMLIRLQIEELPEGVFLATSNDLPGLIVQGNSIPETLEIAKGVARVLIDVMREDGEEPNFPPIRGQRDYTILVAA